MSIEDEAENIFTEHKSVNNICGAYVDENYRKEGVAQQILEHIFSICEQEEKEYLGVDCETLNPNARYFWNKYFDNYTYSYARRIDERIVYFDDYFDSFWKNR